MKKFENSHVNSSGVFPDTIPVDASGPSATDGTEYVALGISDWWGWAQALLTDGGVVPSGTTETKDVSDMQNALKSLFWSPGFIQGLTIANNVTDADHDIDVAVGQAMDSADAALLKLTSGLIKQIDASWAAGTNAGGLFTGTVANDTWYAVFVIEKDSDGSIDAGFDTDSGAANIPGGYTAYRRIGWVLTDGSANIIAFTDTELAGGHVKREWKARIEDLNSTAGGTVRQTTTVSCAPNEIARLIFYMIDTVGSNAWLASVDFTDVAPAQSNADVTCAVASTHEKAEKEINVDASSDVAYRFDVTPDTALRIITVGYTDRRIS
jgi:hypothetical protein